MPAAGIKVSENYTNLSNTWLYYLVKFTLDLFLAKSASSAMVLNALYGARKFSPADSSVRSCGLPMISAKRWTQDRGFVRRLVIYRSYYRISDYRISGFHCARKASYRTCNYRQCNRTIVFRISESLTFLTFFFFFFLFGYEIIFMFLFSDTSNLFSLISIIARLINNLIRKFSNNLEIFKSFAFNSLRK